MSQNWHIATVVHANQEKGWGLAEAKDKKVVFFHAQKAVSLEIIGATGMEARISSVGPQNMPSFPKKGNTIIFDEVVPEKRRGTSYDPVRHWTLTENETWQKLQRTLEKIAATQAELAREREAAEAKRRATIARNLAKYRHDESKKKSGKREKATAA